MPSLTFLRPRQDTAGRMNLWLAVAPLAVLVLMRSAVEIDNLVTRARGELAELEAALTARRSALAGPYFDISDGCCPVDEPDDAEDQAPTLCIRFGCPNQAGHLGYCDQHEHGCRKPDCEGGSTCPEHHQPRAAGGVHIDPADCAL